MANMYLHPQVRGDHAAAVPVEPAAGRAASADERQDQREQAPRQRGGVLREEEEGGQDRAAPGEHAEKQKRQQEMPGVAALVNGKQLTLAQLADECITRHGSDVLDGEINRKILAAGAEPQADAIDDPDIDAEVARAADAYGFVKADGKPDMEKWLKSSHRAARSDGRSICSRRRLAVGRFEKARRQKVDVTDEDLRKGL